MEFKLPHSICGLTPPRIAVNAAISTGPAPITPLIQAMSTPETAAACMNKSTLMPARPDAYGLHLSLAPAAPAKEMLSTSSSLTPAPAAAAATLLPPPAVPAPVTTPQPPVTAEEFAAFLKVAQLIQQTQQPQLAPAPSPVVASAAVAQTQAAALTPG